MVLRLARALRVGLCVVARQDSGERLSRQVRRIAAEMYATIDIYTIKMGTFKHHDPRSASYREGQTCGMLS
jgi:hypothetical protein